MSEMKDIVENGLKSGREVYLTYKDKGDTKYHALCMFKEVMGVKGDATTVEYKNTSQSYSSKVTTGYSIDEVDYEFAATRDNLAVMKELTGKTLSFMVADFEKYLGSKFTGTLTYKFGSASADDIYMGTMHIVPLTAEETHTEDIFDLVEDSVIFDGSINPDSEVLSLATYATVGKEYEIAVSPLATVLTVTNTADSVATATITDKTLKVTPVAEGSTLIKLTGTATDRGISKHGIHVVVTA